MKFLKDFRPKTTLRCNHIPGKFAAHFEWERPMMHAETILCVLAPLCANGLQLALSSMRPLQCTAPCTTLLSSSLMDGRECTPSFSASSLLRTAEVCTASQRSGERLSAFCLWGV